MKALISEKLKEMLNDPETSKQIGPALAKAASSSDSSPVITHKGKKYRVIMVDRSAR